MRDVRGHRDPRPRRAGTPPARRLARLHLGEYRDAVHDAARALAALGVARGDTVACWLANRPEFHVADTAALHLGAAGFSIYPTYTAERAAHVVGDAGSRVLITEPAFLDRALAVSDGGRTALETVVLVEGSHPGALSWAAFLTGGDPAFDVEAARPAVEPTTSPR